MKYTPVGNGYANAANKGAQVKGDVQPSVSEAEREKAREEKAAKKAAKKQAKLEARAGRDVAAERRQNPVTAKKATTTAATQKPMGAVKVTRNEASGKMTIDVEDDENEFADFDSEDEQTSRVQLPAHFNNMPLPVPMPMFGMQQMQQMHQMPPMPTSDVVMAMVPVPMPDGSFQHRLVPIPASYLQQQFQVPQQGPPSTN